MTNMLTEQTPSSTAAESTNLAIRKDLSPQAPEKEIDQVLFDKMKKGSTMTVFEGTLAIQIGVLEPFGYNNVANFFRTESGKTTPAHSMWLRIEAQQAGKLEEMKKEFPDAERRSEYVLKDMQENHANLVTIIKNRVGAPGYKPDF